METSLEEVVVVVGDQGRTVPKDEVQGKTGSLCCLLDQLDGIGARGCRSSGSRRSAWPLARQPRLAPGGRGTRKSRSAQHRRTSGAGSAAAAAAARNKPLPFLRSKTTSRRVSTRESDQGVQNTSWDPMQVQLGDTPCERFTGRHVPTLRASGRPVSWQPYEDPVIPSMTRSRHAA